MSTKIGSLYVEVKGDNTQWKKDMTALRTEAKKYGKDVSNALNSSISPEQANNNIGKIATSLKQLGAAAKVPEKQFKQVADALSEDMRDVAKAVGLTEQEFSNLNEKMLRNRAMQTATRSLKDIANAANMSNKEVKDMAVQMGYSSKEAQDMANSIRKAETSVKQLDRSMDKAERNTRKTSGAFDSFGGVLKTVKAAALGYATVLATMQTTQFAGDIIRQGAALDALNRTYANMTGSTAQARKEMEFIRGTAQNLGLNLNSLEDSYKNIYSAAKNTTLEGEATRDIFEAVSKASAVLGMSADDTTGTLRALSQMISKGNVQAEELRGQLGERLPGAFQMAAEAMEVTTMELNKMLEQGQVAASDLLPRLAVVLESRFGNAAEDAGDRARASFERFGNAIINIQRAIADSGVLEFFANLAESSAAVLDMLSEGIRGASLEKQLATVKTRIEEIEDAERISARKRDKRYQAYLANELKTKAAAMATAEAIQGSHEAAQQAVKTEDEMLNELKQQYTELANQINSFAIADRMHAFAQATMQAKVAAGELVATLNGFEIDGAFFADLDKITEKYDQIQNFINEATMNQYDLAVYHATQKYEVMLELAGDDKKKRDELEKAHQAVLAGLWEEELERRQEVLNERVQAEKDARQWILDAEIQNIRDQEKARQEYWQDEIERMNKIIAEEKKAYEQGLEDKAKAEKDALNEIAKEHEKTAEEVAKEWERAYDDMHEFAADTFYDLFKSTEGGWEGLLDTMEDLFYRSLANMAANAAMTNIFGPLMEGLAGSSLGNMLGLPGSSGGFGLSSLSNIGELFGFGTTSVASSTAGYGATAPGIMDTGTGFGTTAFDLSGTISSAMAAAIPAAVMAGGAMIVSEVFSNWGDRLARAYFYGDEAVGQTYSSGGRDQFGYDYVSNQYDRLESELYDFGISVDHAGDDTALKEQFVDYFDSVFTSIDEIVPDAMDQVLSDHKYTIGSAFGEDGVSLSDLSSDMFSDMLGSLLVQMFPDADTVLKSVSELTGYEATTVKAEELAEAMVGASGRDMENLQDASSFENEFSESFLKPVYETMEREVSALADTFNTDFFAAITPEGGTEWDAFVEFATVVQETGDFMAEFTRRTEELGQSTLNAYTDMLTVTTILTAIQDDLDDMASSTEWQDGFDAINDAFDVMIESLEDAAATSDQVTQALDAQVQMQGAYITGLTGASVQQSLSSGTGISSIVTQSMQSMMASTLAGDLMENYLNDFNVQVAEAFADGGEDAVLAVYESFDFGPVESEIDEFLSYFEEGIEDLTREAELLAAEALQGGLTAAQMVEQWGIANAEVAELLASITEDGITADELESAVDAFHDLGIEGDDLTTIIGYLADAFVDAADDLSAALSDIDSIKSDIPSTDNLNETTLEAFQEAFNSFLDLPSLSSVTDPGYEYVTKEVDTPLSFDEDMYLENKQAVWESYHPDETLKTLEEFEAAMIAAYGSLESHFVNAGVDEGVSPFEGITADDLTNVEWVIDGSNIDFTIPETVTEKVEGSGNELASSEAEISAALDALEAFVGSTDYQGFFDTLDTIASDVLYDIFGDDAASSISDVGDAYRDYLDSLESDSSDSSSSSSDTDYDEDQLASILEQIQYDLDTLDLSDFEKEIFDIEKSVEDYIASLEELGGATDENTDLVNEWGDAMVAAAEAAEAADLLNDQLALQNELYSLMEDEASLQEVINQQREIELAAMDESLQAIQENIWALQEEAEAAEAAADLLNQQLSLENELYSLMEDETALQEVINQQREIELAAMDESLQAIQEHIWALEDEIAAEEAAADAAAEAESALVEAYGTFQDLMAEQEQAFIDAEDAYISKLEEEISEKQDLVDETETLIDTFGDLKDSMSDFHMGILTGSNSPLGLDQRAALAEDEFLSLAEAARGGDEDAMSDLTGAASTLLDTALEAGSGYSDIFAMVQKELNAAGAAAENEVSASEEELSSLETQISLQENLIDEISGFEDQTLDQLEENYEYEKAQYEALEEQNAIFQEMFVNDLAQYDGIMDLVEQSLDQIAATEAVEAAISALGNLAATSSSSPVGEIDSGPTSYLDEDVVEAVGRDIYSAVGWTGDPDELKSTYGFATGGTISGPESGYTVPTTFHGTEPIVTNDHMGDVVSVLQEVKGVLISLRDTDGNINKMAIKTNRILDRLTQGGTELRTKEIA